MQNFLSNTIHFIFTCIFTASSSKNCKYNFLYSLQLLPSYCGCNKYSQSSLADVTHPTVVKYTVELFAVYTQFLYISFANFYSRIRSFEVYNDVFQYYFVTIRMAEWSKALPWDWEVKGSIPVETNSPFSKFLPF